MIDKFIPGFYGKLPGVADFVSSRLPPDFVQPWDLWLQNAIASSKQALLDNWLEAYLSCPVWRFALTPGVCGESGWLGILAPSVDHLGRYFPITLAAPIQQSINNLHRLDFNSDWYRQLEKAALSVLAYHDTGVDYLETLLEQIPLAGASDLLCDPEGNDFSPHSLWYAQSAQYPQALQLGFTGLPAADAFAGLMTSNLTNQHPEYLPVVQHPVLESSQIDFELEDFDQHYASNAVQASEEQRLQVTDWHSYARTDKGHHRRHNQDAFLDRPDLGLWAVADGMGGHHAGDVASRLIVHELNKLQLTKGIYSRITQVQDCLQYVNQDLRHIAKQFFASQIIGSTVIALIAQESNFAFLWAGDSRLYHLRNGKLIQLSIDHSATPSGQSKSAQKSHIITRAIGAHDELDLDCSTLTAQSGDKFLLCSDGLDNELEAQEIEQFLAQYNCKDAVEKMLVLTLNREARDNVTILVVEVL